MEERIAKDQWDAFFKDFAKTHHGYEAYIEIIGREFGDQQETTWLPFSGVSYDPHGNQVIITVGGISSRCPAHLTHMIDKPSQLAFRQGDDSRESTLMVVGPDETETLVHIRRQPQLPPTGSR